ncbi:MAG: VWA domain-containing protein [Gammaproteobacteria bacterium]
MLSFAWPWFALLLPLPWLLAWQFRRPSRAREGDSTNRVLLNPAVSRLEAAFASDTPRARGYRWLWELLGGLFWAALVVALMGPQRLDRYTEAVSHGRDLMLAVDISRSMEALDFQLDGRPVNRLAVVKGVVGSFIELRRGDRIGLILFGDVAYLQAPLTLDGAAVRAMLEGVVPRMAGDATAIGDAVGLAVKKLREREAGGRVIILLTDGENTAGGLPPLEAARLARHHGIRIYAIGVGSHGQVPFPEGDDLVMKTVPLDEGLLQVMSEMTDGVYFRATDTDALRSIYRHIDGLEATEAVTHSTYVPRPLFRWPLAFAGGLLLGLAGLALVDRQSRLSR